MAWDIRITDDAKKDYSKIEGSIRKQVLAGILKVSKAPLPSPNGYGKPLGNRNGNNLTGFFKIKYRGIGIRVVYTLVIDKRVMNIMVLFLCPDMLFKKPPDFIHYDFIAEIFSEYMEICLRKQTAFS